MPWRHVLLNNLWWKLLAFALAVMIWSGAQKLEVDPFTQPFRTPEVRSFPDVPVRVVTRPDQMGPVQVTPGSVRLDIEGDPSAIRHLRLDDLMAFVDLTSESGSRAVEVRLPPGIKLIHLAPQRVDVSPLPARPSAQRTPREPDAHADGSADATRATAGA